MLTSYARRWSIEEAFHDAKGSLGFEEPQGWSKPAVERTAPTAMLLYSLVLLWFARCGHRFYRPRQRPWYCSKSRAPFIDMLAALPRESVREQVSLLQPAGRGSRNLVKSLLHAVKQAA